MKIDILTLFPKMFEGFLQESIIKRALEKKLVEINVIDFRLFSQLPHHQVDDTPYGGGGGMVLRPEPLIEAILHYKKENTKVILMCPQGVPFKQAKARALSKESHLILVCGHYEGFDERIRTLADMEISIGDYVLTGGEIPSMVITDSITRLLDGVIEKESHLNDSFNNNLLDYPVYTKPVDFRGMKVPDVLLSGHHANIKKYREEEALKKTKERRPDLLERDD